MKKIVNPTGFNRLEGVAEKDGVTIRPYLGRTLIFPVGPTIRATVDENGLISRKRVERQEEYNQMKDKLKKLEERAFICSFIATILIFILGFVLAAFEHPWFFVPINLMYLSIAAIFLSKKISILFARIFKDKEVIEYSKYLGAKNAAINAFNDKGKALKLEDVKEYSLYSNSWGSKGDTITATTFLILGVFRFLPPAWYILSIVVVFSIVMILEKKNILAFWQVLEVSKPDDKHYNAAIEALNGVVEAPNELAVILGYIAMMNFEPRILELTLKQCEEREKNDSCKKRDEHVDENTLYKDTGRLFTVISNNSDLETCDSGTNENVCEKSVDSTEKKSDEDKSKVKLDKAEDETTE